MELGMSMDSVKMGRIPKKVKEKALRNHLKRQKKSVNLQSKDKKSQTTTISSDDYRNLSSQMTESTSSGNSFNTQHSKDESPDIIVVSSGK
jgi:hypothetical protein